MTARAPSAGRVLVDTLLDLGVRRAYCVPGESFLEVLDALGADPRARLVSTRHESGAAFMAEADAKLTGVPAIAAATRAPGAANLAIGVHTAWHDSTPMVVLLGQVERDLLASDAGFQGIDLEAFYGPITKWRATLASAGDAAALASEAFAVATSGRPGPVALVLPADVLAQPVPAAGPAGVPLRPRAPTPPPAGQPPPAGEEALEAIVARLAAARRPVMIVGGRTATCRSELVALAEALGIGVYAAFRRQDRFPNDHPAYLGHLTIATAPPLLEALREADVVLALGCRLSEVTTQRFTLPAPSAFVVRVDAFPSGASPGRPPRPPDLELVADVAAAVSSMAGLALRTAGGVHGSATLERFAAAHGRYLAVATVPPLPAGTTLHPAEVVASLARHAAEDCVVASDAGNFSIFLHRYWHYRHPLTQLAPTSGAMGYAVPAAVAAALVDPRRQVVALAGDGGYLMTGNELETAVRLGLRLTVIVMRNGCYGTIAMHQARSFGRLAGTEIGEVDLARHARSLGAAGFTARGRDELDGALRAALGSGGVALVDAVVDPDVVAPDVRLSTLGPVVPLS